MVRRAVGHVIIPRHDIGQEWERRPGRDPGGRDRKESWAPVRRRVMASARHQRMTAGQMALATRR